jgi:hypothetical protein
MNNNDLNRLSNDLLTAFFDKAEATELIKIADRYQIPITGKIFKKATERAIVWLESGDNSVFDVLTPENRDRIVADGLQNISQKFGATLGKDFSKAADGGLLITDELMSKIMADMRPQELAKFKKAGYIKSVTQDPFKMLDDSLGVPFFTKLEAISKLRLATLSDAEACEYVGMLGGGLQNKHNWISIEWCVHFCHKILGADRFKQVMNHPETDSDDSDEGIVGSLVFDDLLTALGREDRKLDEELGAVVSIDDLMALDKVFRGERFSCAELAEQLRRVQEKHRKK